MSTNRSNDNAAQLKRLYEERAKVDKLIKALLGEDPAAAAVNHLIPILGFTNFKKPGSKEKYNLQLLCGLDDRMWSIFKHDLKEVAGRQGVDSRLSIKNQLTQQCIADAVHEMIIYRPEIKQKLSDPDWFIRQALRGILKSSSETYRNLVNNKPARSRKAKDEDEDEGGGEDEDEGEDEDAEMDKQDKANNTAGRRAKESSRSNDKAPRPKAKKPTRIEEEDEDEDEEMAAPGNIKDPAPPQAIPKKNLDAHQDRRASPEGPQEPKKRPTAEDIHTIREPEWSSPLKSSFGLPGDDSFLGATPAPRHDASDDELPTPKPFKDRATRAHNKSTNNRIRGTVNPALTSQVVVKRTLTKGQVAYNEEDSGEEEDREPNARDQDPTPEDEQPMPKRSTTKVSRLNLTTGEDGSKTIFTKALKVSNAANTQKRKGSASQKAVATTAASDVQPADPAASTRKRKGRDEDSDSETPAPKKGKNSTLAPLKTPARAKLIKNLETPLPASPAHAARLTRAGALPLQGASSSSIPPSASMAAPMTTLSKSEAKKAAALKGAATRAANKKAKEEAAKAKADNESKTRKGKK